MLCLLLLARPAARWLVARPAWHRVEAGAARLLPQVRGARGFSSANDLSSLGSAPLVAAAGALGVALALAGGRRGTALALALAAFVPGLLGRWLKHHSALARPVAADGGFAAPVTFGSSFPSNRSAMAAAWWPCATAAAIAATAVPVPVQDLLWAATLVLVLAVGCTRVMLRAHFVLDVLGGWLLGAAWGFAAWQSRGWMGT